MFTGVGLLAQRVFMGFHYWGEFVTCEGPKHFIYYLFEVISDALLLDIGVGLMQDGRPCAYASKKFSSSLSYNRPRTSG